MDNPPAWLRVESLRRAFASITPARFLYGFVVALAVVLCANGAFEHARRVNKNLKDKDQSAYLTLGERIGKTHAIQVDGARPPLYTALLALGWKADLSREAYFERCKRINVVATLAGWLALLFLLRRYLKPLGALVTWLALGFTVYLFYAPYVRAEGVFYSLATAAFILHLRLLHRPKIKTAVYAGVVTALAQLTKESLLPSLAMLVAAQVAFALYRYRVQRQRKSAAKRALVRRLLTLPVVVFAFLLVVSPHIAVNKRVFGHYFYNVNSYFYLWYDSWGQVTRGTKGHGDRHGWPRLPDHELPSARRYFATHSAEQIVERVTKGTRGMFDRAAASHGYLRYAGFGALCVLSAWITSLGARRFLTRNWHVTAYALAYFSLYSLLCAWFYVVHTGPRFFVALVPPLAFVGAWLSERDLKSFGRFGLWTVIAGASILMDIPVALGRWVTSMTSAGW